MNKWTSLLASLLLSACLTDAKGEQHVDLFKVHQGLQLVESRFSDASTVYFDTDPTLAADFRRWQESVRKADDEVEAALADGTRIPDTTLLLNELDAAVDGLLTYVSEDKEKQAEVRTWGILIGTGVDLVKLSLEAPPPIPQP